MNTLFAPLPLSLALANSSLSEARLKVHDLAISKLVAGREKDIEFVGALFRHKLARAEIVREHLDLTTLSDSLREICFERIKRLAGRPAPQ